MIKNIRNEKGVTMITLIATVALLIIITGILATRSYTSVQLSNLTKLKNDIEVLNNRTAAYKIKREKTFFSQKSGIFGSNQPPKTEPAIPPGR